MSRPTQAELDLLRTRPHRTHLYLSIYQPPTVFAAQVNDASIAKGDHEITFDNVTDGAYTDVQSGMTVLVGSSPGEADIGQVRARSATSTVLTVAENDDIPWEDDQYLTVLRFWRIWPIYYRQVQNGEDVTYYKDYDILHSEQNNDLGTLICMGPHHAGFLDESDEHRVYYTASGTYNLKGEGLNYDWHFIGGSPTGSTSHTPGYVTYDTPGHYTTSLTVTPTGSSSAEDVSYRHISIYDHPERGTSNPVIEWNLESLHGDRETGGYTATLWVKDDVSRDVLRDGALVVIWAEDWYGDTKQSIGGNALNREQIFFVGYVSKGSIEYSYADSVFRFEAVSPTLDMREHRAFSLTVQSKTDANSWYEILELNITRAMYHYYRWHSTVLMCCDFEYTGTDLAIEYFDPDAQDLYAGVNTFLQGTILGSLVSDRQGKLWAEQEASTVDGATGTTSINMEVTDADWMNAPVAEEEMYSRTSALQLGGLYYDGPATDDFDAFLSMAPGDAPSYAGSPVDQKGLALTDQAHLNQLSGSLLALKNARYPSISLDFAGNYRNLDIAPQDALLLTVPAAKTPRQIAWNLKPFQVKSVVWRYSGEKGVLLPEAEASEITAGPPGVTVPIPDTPPDDGFDIPSFSIPAGVINLFFYSYPEAYVAASVEVGTTEYDLSTSTGSWSTISSPWQDELFDTDDFWTVSDPSKMTIPEDGRYFAWVSMAYYADSTADPDKFLWYNIRLQHQRSGSPVDTTDGSLGTPLFALTASNDITNGSAAEFAPFECEAGDVIVAQYRADINPSSYSPPTPKMFDGTFTVLKIGEPDA